MCRPGWTGTPAKILRGTVCEFSSPLVADIAGRGQVVVAQGDGWVCFFNPLTGELLWEFDINFKASKYKFGPGSRNYFLASPVLY
jgi:hypothetical protein